MSRPHGTVTAAGGELVVRIADGHEEPALWDDVVSSLANVEHRHSDRAAFVEATYAPQLRHALAQYPASRILWDWSPGASARAANATAEAEALNALTARDRTDHEDYTEELRARGFVRPLRPFQERALDRLVAMRNGADFSVPGAGKTTVALALYAVLRARGVVNAMVVVAPPQAFESWRSELGACFARDRQPELAVPSIEPSDKDPDIFALNYERLELQRTFAQLDRWARGRQLLVVFDEAHRAKAGSAGVRGAMSRVLAERAARRLVLTGTPMPNSLSDLAAVFDLAWPGQGARLAFGDLADVRHRAFVRVPKQELGLPRIEMRTDRVELDTAHRTLYRAMANRVVLDDAASRDAASIGQAVMRLLAAATNPASVVGRGGRFEMPPRPVDADLADLLASPEDHIRPAKIVRAAQLVADNAARGRKTLVWSSFLKNVAALERVLASHQPAVVTGETPMSEPSAPRDRARELERFRGDASCMVLIATPQTLGEGVSLHQVCFDQVHVDRGFAAGTFLQSLDRTHRLGMPADSAPTCTVLVAEGTIDERADSIVSAKVDAMFDAVNDASLRPMSGLEAPGPVSLEELLLDGANRVELVALLNSALPSVGDHQ